MKPGFEPKIVSFDEEKEGWSAFFVMDSLYSGTAIGGIRITTDITLEEVKILARGMTKKLLFAGLLKRGGAKGGIRLPVNIEAEKRKKILSRYGEIIGQFLREGSYNPGPDLGTNDQDLVIIKRGGGLSVPSNKRFAPDIYYFTALSVFASAKAYCTHLNFPLSGLKIAVEGFGNVGAQISALLHQAGNKIVAVSTRKKAILNWKGLDIPRLVELRKEHADNTLDHYPDAEVIPRSNLLTLNVDILIPGARIHTINKTNARSVEAKAVIPVSNVPLSPEGEAVLQSKGIFYISSYVSNAGGIMGGGLSKLGFRGHTAERIILEDYCQRITQLLNESRKRSILPVQVAEEWIQHRAREWDDPSIYEKAGSEAIRIFAGLSRRKMIPSSLSRPVLLRTVRNTLKKT